MTTNEPVITQGILQKVTQEATIDPGVAYSVTTSPGNTSFLPATVQFDESERIRQAIDALSAQRATLGDDVVDTALIALQKRMADISERSAPHQRKQATVLFADVSGFTALAENLDAEDLHTIMNELWKRLDLAIHNRKGTIDKHIGDAVMALFGAPQARENDPELAVRAALDMQQELAEFNDTLRGMGFPNANLQMRIGVNTGPVLAGEVGTIGEYTAMGDTVNLASRLESSAPIGGILISQSTHLHVTGMFVTEPQAPLRVKGKVETIHTYIVKEAKANAYLIPNRGLEGITTRMIGRKNELEQLQEAYSHMQLHRQIYVASVVGEAGVGKSRMMDEFGKWLVQQPKQHTILHGRATSELLGQPYALMRNIFMSQIGIRDSDPAATIRRRLESEIIKLMGEEGREKAHFIGHLMGFNFSDSPYIRGILSDVKQIRDRAFHYIAQLLHRQTENTPVVLMLEDVHWADIGSLEMLDYLAAECSEIPLLIVAPMRASLLERWPQWGNSHQNPVQVTLNPLSEASSNELIDEILCKASEIPDALRELIITNAEGNPFYIEELIKVLIEDGVIIAGADNWSVKSQLLGQVKIPPTLTALLQARLDRLEPIERIVLQRAAVIGRIFWDGAVINLCDENGFKQHDDKIAGQIINKRYSRNLNAVDLKARLDYSRALSTLLERELIYVRETPAFSSEREYIFSHAILHQVVYESVLKRQRPIYHRQAAEWLIERSDENVGQYAARIAVHFEQTLDNEETTYWYGRAANQARETYAPETAIEYYEKALVFYADDQAHQQIALYQGLGEMLRWQARYEDAENVYREMCKVAKKSGSWADQAHAWSDLSVVQDRQSNHQASLYSAEEAYRLARRANKEVKKAFALLGKNQASYRLGGNDDTIALGQLSLTYPLVQHDDLHSITDHNITDHSITNHSIEEVTALLYKGGANHRLGNNDEALRLGKLSLKLSQELNDKRSIARSHNLLSLTHMIFGHYQQAQQNLEASIQLFRELGDRRSVALLINNLGKAASLRNDYGAAANFFQEALLIAREIGDRDTATLNLLNLGAAQNDQGEFGPAEENLREVIQRTEDGEWFGLPFAYSVLAEALMGQGKLNEAFEMADKSLHLAQKTGLKEQVGLSWLVLGQIACRQLESDPSNYRIQNNLQIPDINKVGIQVDKPGFYFSNSLNIFSSIGAEADKARTLSEWAKYEDVYGDRVRAKVMGNQAQKIFKELKLRPL